MGEPAGSETPPTPEPASPGEENPSTPDLLAAIPEAVLNALASGDPTALMAAVVSVQATVGWLPPPQMLREYETIRPGFTDELLGMVKQQETHRQHLEKVTVEGNDRRATQGLWIGAATSILFLGAATGLGIAGQQIAAGVIAGVDIVGLATVFVIGRREQRAERRDKAQLSSGNIIPRSEPRD